MKKIILDTDIGGDIDDALALALALNSPEEIEILGITTVYLAAHWRAKVIRRMLETFGREDIKTALGAEKPLIGLWDKSHIPDTGNASEETDGIVSKPACDYIIDKVYENEDAIIVAIGPLTNIALSLAKDPTLAKKTKLVIMGGQITRAHPEWNILCDPEAARMVFESNIHITMIGLDVTEKCVFTHEHIKRFKDAGNKRCDHLHGMIETFLEKFKFMPVLHDPLALSTLIWDDIVKFKEKTVKIETKGEFTRGVTVDIRGNPDPNANVAVDVKSDEFIERLLSRLIK